MLSVERCGESDRGVATGLRSPGVDGSEKSTANCGRRLIAAVDDESATELGAVERFWEDAKVEPALDESSVSITVVGGGGWDGDASGVIAAGLSSGTSPLCDRDAFCAGGESRGVRGGD